MRLNALIAGAAITLGLCSSGYAAQLGGPSVDVPWIAGMTTTPVQRDCHRSSRRHYLDEYGRRVWHHHNRYCRVILDESFDDDYSYNPRLYDPYPGSRRGCYIAGSPPLTFEYCP